MKGLAPGGDAHLFLGSICSHSLFRQQSPEWRLTDQLLPKRQPLEGGGSWHRGGAQEQFGNGCGYVWRGLSDLLRSLIQWAGPHSFIHSFIHRINGSFPPTVVPGQRGGLCEEVRLEEGLEAGKGDENGSLGSVQRPRSRGKPRYSGFPGRRPVWLRQSGSRIPQVRGLGQEDRVDLREVAAFPVSDLGSAEGF